VWHAIASRRDVFMWGMTPTSSLGQLDSLCLHGEFTDGRPRPAERTALAHLVNNWSLHSDLWRRLHHMHQEAQMPIGSQSATPVVHGTKSPQGHQRSRESTFS
jgi:hypothetical protein